MAPVDNDARQHAARCAAPCTPNPRPHVLDKFVNSRLPVASGVAESGAAAPTLIRKPLNPSHPEYHSSRAAIAQQELVQVDAYLALLRERAPSEVVTRHISEALCERQLVAMKLHRLLLAQGMPSDPPGPAPALAPFCPLRRREWGALPQPGDYDFAPAPPR